MRAIKGGFANTLNHNDFIRQKICAINALNPLIPMVANIVIHVEPIIIPAITANPSRIKTPIAIMATAMLGTVLVMGMGMQIQREKTKPNTPIKLDVKPRVIKPKRGRMKYVSRSSHGVAVSMVLVNVAFFNDRLRMVWGNHVFFAPYICWNVKNNNGVENNRFTPGGTGRGMAIGKANKKINIPNPRSCRPSINAPKDIDLVWIVSKTSFNNVCIGRGVWLIVNEFYISL